MLRVLGAGQPRTGTRSLHEALEILGFGPCFHMLTLLLERPEEIRYFIDARDTGTARWDELFASYGSAVDFPASLYYRSILKSFPDAKVILTVRDSKNWFRSISETVFPASQPSPAKILKTMLRAPFDAMVRRRLPVLKYAGRMIRSFYGPDLANEEAVIGRFERWNQEAIAVLPKEQLLVFDVREGWGPLCAFLGVPVPETPFPNTNSAREFKENASRM